MKYFLNLVLTAVVLLQCPNALGGRLDLPEGVTDFPFPVRSALAPSLKSVSSHKLKGLSQSFFLVGDDRISYRWLKKYAAVLRDKNALGLVVNVPNRERFNHLRRLVPGLKMLPVQVDRFAAGLGIDSYPVLLTED